MTTSSRSRAGRRLRGHVQLLALSLACACTGRSAAAALDSPGELLSAYLERIVDGDFAAADALWAARDRTHAARLGVRYPGVAIKQDLDSVLWAWLEPIRARELRVGVETIFVERDRAELALSFLDPPVRARTVMAAERIGAQWRLASRLRHLVEGWNQIEGRWVKLFVPMHRPIDPTTRPAWDREADRILTALGADPAVRARVAAGKVDVILADETEMVRLVGQPTEGWTHLGFDTVVTQRSLHPHELVHVLVNAVSRELPLYVLPVLQEGIATHLGGRSGRSSAVLEMLGAWLLASGTSSLDAVLDRGGFAGAGADVAYPVAGLFCGYLLERFGPERFLEIYRAGAGTDPQLAALTPEEVKRRLAQAAAVEWAEIVRGFDAWWPSRQDAGIRPSALRAALPSAPPRSWRGAGGTLSVSAAGGELQIEWRPASAPVRGPVCVALYDERPLAGPGRLHREQLGEAAVGARAALVLGPDEAGLYDFVADQVVAKWVRAFSPGPEPLGEARASLRYELDRGLLDVDLLSLRWELVEAVGEGR